MSAETTDHLPDVGSMEDKKTKGVQLLLGEPKKAVIKLAIPMIIAMSANTLYSLFDAFWVSGLGADELAAVGFFFPFLFMAMAIAIGLGVGGGAAISRRIGAKDRLGADDVAMHTMVLMVITALVFTVPLFLFAEDLFSAIGAGRITGMAASYARVLFGGAIAIFFMNVATALFRAEGDAKRAMYAMMLGSVINIGLDPIFIYTFEMGVVGAAWATLVSMLFTSFILFYWMYIKKDTFISYTRISLSDFKFRKDILWDIFRVGIPASVLQLSMSFTMLIQNVIIVQVEGTDGVAVFTTGWRVSMIAILPLLGIATAVVSVTGAAFGARDLAKLRTSFFYAVKIGVVVESTIAILTVVLAAQITAVFTQSEDTSRIADDLIVYFQIVAIFYPGVAFGMFSSSMFQGTGKGMYALFVTLVRTIFLTVPLTLIFAYPLSMGLPGIWWGMVVGNGIGSIFAFILANLYLRDLKRGMHGFG